MMNDVDTLSLVVFIVVIACWWVFALGFFFRKKPQQVKQQKRDRTSLLGAALVGVGYALVWSIHRPMFTPIFPFVWWIGFVLAVVTVVMCVGSVWLVLSAVRTLGKQWSLTAQVVEDHRLIVEVPYSIVRHPIYTGMLGMMVATGLAISTPLSLLIAAIIGWCGTWLRIRSEERLLKEAFGKQFEEYVGRVPALLPRLPWLR
jgi:protein-S-isoprenylcysteine O-methyltransferase Ste14